MSFVSTLFLWGLVSLSIPVVIALWNRRQNLVERFGGFYLLKKTLETQTRRIRLLELLKLINRLVLLAALVFVLADPFKNEKVNGEAAEGFVIMVDAGRAMISKSVDGDLLANLQKERLLEVLSDMPQQSRGMVMWVTNQCDVEEWRGGEITARSRDWIERLSAKSPIILNRPTTVDGVRQCLKKVDEVFGGKTPFRLFLSPMPRSLDQAILQKLNLSLERIEGAQALASDPIEVEQEMKAEILSVILKKGPVRQAHLILPDGIEALGPLESSMELISRPLAWFWLEGERKQDPWIDQDIVPLRQKIQQEVTVWAAKETPGFLSLLAALRNHPDLRVVRQVGGSPQGSALIVYGPTVQVPASPKKIWFFLDSEGITPFEIRDKKTLNTSQLSADVLRSFQMSTGDGRITVKRYLILDPSRFETISTFEDGAPALIRDRESLNTHFISPFDLEDLTTDLTLEPTFIPFLYDHLQKWLGDGSEAASDQEKSELVWSLPSSVEPSSLAIERRDWPGVYRAGASYFSVAPVAYPDGFFEPTVKAVTAGVKDEPVSFRPLLYRVLIISALLELLLCLLTVPALMRRLTLIFFVCLGALSFSLEAKIRSICVGVTDQMDGERRKSLSQLASDAAGMTNLDLSEPQTLTLDRMWECSIVVFSSSTKWGPFSDADRAKIRDYLERGGFFIFDDPLAMADTLFARSVKEELSKIFPGRQLEAVSKDDVLFRTFYLLNEVSGRKLASPYLEGIKFDRRWLAVFSANDLLGAYLRNDRGEFVLSVSPYGVSQRVLAQRLMLNLLMYGSTTDYKDDAIHLPHILKRRVR